MSHWLRRIKATLGMDEPLHETGNWRSQIEEMLYDGESVTETFELDSARLVVTSHRVLTFAPEIDGANFRQVDRPNVARVRQGAQGEVENIVRGIKYGTIGLLLFVGGSLIDFGAIIGDVNLESSGASEIGIGGTLGMVQQMLDLIAQIDDLMRTFGLLALFLSAVMFGVYALTRVPTLVVEIAGDDDIHLPRPENATVLIQRIETAVTGTEQPAPPEPPRDPLEQR